MTNPANDPLSPQYDFRSLFLGPHGENQDMLRRYVNRVVDEVVRHRLQPTSLRPDPESRAFDNVWVDRQIERALGELMSRLRGQSELAGVGEPARRLTINEIDNRGTIECWSGRYIGHQLADGVLTAALGRLIGDLTWQNNVYGAVSTVTTHLEHEVIATLARILGYNPLHRPMDVHERGGVFAGGRLTSGGTVANAEALWIMREKSYAAIGVYNTLLELNLMRHYERIYGELIEHPDTVRKDFWRIFDNCRTLGRKLKNRDVDQAFKDAFYSYRYMNVDRYSREHLPRPVYITSVEAHYSLNKNVGLLGGSIPHDRFLHLAARDRREDRQRRLQDLTDRYDLWFVDVDPDSLRMDLKGLEAYLQDAVTKRQKGHDPVMIVSVVPTLGTTEPCVFDPLHEILKMRAEYYANERLWFYIHADCAWGGMLRLVRSEMSADAHLALNETGAADSCTVDPHKLGYIPYPAGALVLKDRRDLAFIDVSANYLFKDDKEPGEDLNLGIAAIEGSKPGSTATACWLTFLSMTSELVQSPADANDPCDLYRPLLSNGLRNARMLAAGLQSLGYIHVVHPVDGNLLCVQVLPEDIPGIQLDPNACERGANVATQLLVEHFNSLPSSNQKGPRVSRNQIERDFVVSSTTIARTDRECLRLTLMNPYLVPVGTGLPVLLDEFVQNVREYCLSEEFRSTLKERLDKQI